MGTLPPLIAGNWKMNKLPSEAEGWGNTFKDALTHLNVNAEVLICAPFTHLAGLRTVFTDSPVAVGSQDVSQHSEGAYTGEVSAAMLKDIGVSYAIIGHSERRDYHRESDALINAKVKKTLETGLRPILCIGETLTQRESGKAESVVLGQLNAGLNGVTFKNADDLVIAYEPVWAIGTGKTATAEDAQAMSSTIRTALKKLYPNHADGIRILYGGSMKPSNAKELLDKPDINGGLIGGASLKVEDLVDIVKAVSV
ncbi:MAG: triose-phosphate isomerase [Trueperaceae bacterium]